MINIINKKISMFFFLLSITAFSQNAVIEEIVPKNDKVITKTKYSKTAKNENIIIDKFYLSQNNGKVLDSLMSFRFYQKTPYNKFKKIIESKVNSFGKFVDKTLINRKKSNDGITIYKFKVRYERITTIEEIGLFRENEKDSYHIISYNIS